MKKQFKLLFIAIFMFMIASKNVLAVSNETAIMDIDDSFNITVDYLSFSNMMFKKNSNHSLKLFGTLYNSYRKPIKYSIEISFYDSNGEFIAKSIKEGVSGVNSNNYNKNLDLIMFDNHKPKEIKKYSVVVNYDETSIEFEEYIPDNDTLYEVQFFENKDYMFLFFLGAIFILITAYICVPFNKIKKIEMIDIKNFNSYEVGELYSIFSWSNKKHINNIYSLILYLANKGYIKIEKMDLGNNYYITKVKEYDGQNEYEKKCMKYLFSSKKNILNLRKIFDFYDTPKIKYIPFTFCIILVNILIINYACFIDKELAFIIYLRLIFIFGFKYLVLMAIGFSAVKPNEIIFASFVNLFFSILFGFLVINPEFTTYYIIIEIILYIISYISFFILERNILNNYYGVLKFRKYLLNINKGEVFKLYERNSNYFYDVLPYALALGIYDEFIKKFGCISGMSETILLKNSDFKGLKKFFHNNFFLIDNDNC